MGMTPVTNYILVKPFPSDLIKVGDDNLYFVTPNEEKGAMVRGMVKGVCDFLDFEDINFEWETEIEVMVGDEIVFNYLAAGSAIKQFKQYEVDGEMCLLIHYSNIYALKRDGEVIPVNGYCLLEPIEEMKGFEDMVESKENAMIGKVVYKGLPCKSYKHYPNHLSDDRVKVGDMVAFTRFRNLRLEYLEQFIEQKLFRVQDVHIHAILK